MPQNVLKEVFGFDAFRPGQEQAIRAVLDGRDTLAVMSTGGGKSLCYQIPALMMESLTVIVSPLISLMKDQVDSLLQSSVGQAATLHSGLSPQERWEVERRVRTGEIRMLYVAPERLRSLEFVLALRRAGVGLFVVDEAHCISEWGHDFRPDYLFLPRVIKDLGSPPVLALTATATPKVRQDIQRSIHMRSPEVVVTSFNRPNLTYRVRPVAREGDRARYVKEIIKGSEPPGIVYSTTRKQCEELAGELRAAGIDAEHYHAGLAPDDRSDVQERFMTDELSVVVATVAFGMGVDKPNVRFVIHASAPGSLPAYIQEAGRAGRDGDPSECVVLFRGADLGRRKRLVSMNTLGDREVESFLRALSRAAGESGAANVPPGSLAREAGVSPDMEGVLLRSLEDAGLLSRSYDLWAEVTVDHVAEEPEELHPHVAAVHAALPGSGSLPLPELAHRARVRPSVAQAALSHLGQRGVVEFVPRGSLLDVRLGDGDLGPAATRNALARLKRRNGVAYDQIEEFGTYATLDACRREHLLRHFGDEEDVAPCSGCDVCLGESYAAEATPAEATPADRPPARAGGKAEGKAGSKTEGRTVAQPAYDPDDVDRELFERLRRWRMDRAQEQSVPAYVVLYNSHLEHLAANRPTTVAQIGGIKGVGTRKAERYGAELLALIHGDSAEEPHRKHLTAAAHLLESGRGAEAVEELSQALKVGGDEARREVDELLR